MLWTDSFVCVRAAVWHVQYDMPHEEQAPTDGGIRSGAPQTHWQFLRDTLVISSFPLCRSHMKPGAVVALSFLLGCGAMLLLSNTAVDLVSAAPASPCVLPAGSSRSRVCPQRSEFEMRRRRVPRLPLVAPPSRDYCKDGFPERGVRQGEGVAAQSRGGLRFAVCYGALPSPALARGVLCARRLLQFHYCCSSASLVRPAARRAAPAGWPVLIGSRGVRFPSRPLSRPFLRLVPSMDECACVDRFLGGRQLPSFPHRPPFIAPRPPASPIAVLLPVV